MKSASKKLYGRGTDWRKIPTSKLNEILADPYTRGIDGKDYAPYREELEQELWRRQNDHMEKAIKRWDLEFKKQLKEQKAQKEKSA